MNRILLAALLPLTLSMSACGGSEDEKSSSSASQLTGTWYSASLRTSWTFNSGGTGQLRTKSFDNISCQITDIEFSVNSSGTVITYYGTRYQQKSTPTRSDDYNQTTRRGPFTAGYSFSGSSVSIGNGTYQRGSTACS